MNAEITRVSSDEVATVPNEAAISGPIDYRGFAMGGLVTPSALAATTVIGYKVAQSLSGTFTPLYTGANALVTTTVTLNASRAYPLPDELSGWAYFKIWTQASGVDVNQAADRAFVVCKKS